MPDKKPKNDNRQRSTEFSDDDREIQYLMMKSDLSPNRARDLIYKHGGSRKKIEAELESALEFGNSFPWREALKTIQPTALKDEQRYLCLS
ncbi:hypothetical protein ABIC60_003281 [Phyllobacterium ifriqiyense]